MKNSHVSIVPLVLAFMTMATNFTLAAGKAPSTSSHPFANTTLSYMSHMCDNNIYFGAETKGRCPFYSHSFRTNESYQGIRSYTIKQLEDSKWEIATIDDADSGISRTFVFWITAIDLNAPDGQIVIKADGNAYQAGKPLWPNGERCMTLTFRRGNHLQQIF